MKLTKYGRREWGTATLVAAILLAGTIACGFLFASNAGFYLSILNRKRYLSHISHAPDPYKAARSPLCGC